MFLVCDYRKHKNSNETRNQSKKHIKFAQTKRKSRKIIVSANRAHDTQWHGANIWSNSFIVCTVFSVFVSELFTSFSFFFGKNEKEKPTDIRIILHIGCISFWLMLLQLRIDIDTLTSQYILKLSCNYHFVHAIHFSMIEKLAGAEKQKRNKIKNGRSRYEKWNHLMRGTFTSESFESELDCALFFVTVYIGLGPWRMVNVELRIAFHCMVFILHMNRPLVPIVH